MNIKNTLNMDIEANNALIRQQMAEPKLKKQTYYDGHGIGYQQGYIDGLEAAANLVGEPFADYRGAQILRDEAKRVRKMGVNNENTQ